MTILHHADHVADCPAVAAEPHIADGAAFAAAQLTASGDFLKEAYICTFCAVAATPAHAEPPPDDDDRPWTVAAIIPDGFPPAVADAITSALDSSATPQVAPPTDPPWPTQYDVQLAIPTTCQQRIRTGERRGFSGTQRCGEDAAIIAIRRDAPDLAYAYCAAHADAIGPNWRRFPIRHAAAAQRRLAALDEVQRIAWYNSGGEDGPAMPDDHQTITRRRLAADRVAAELGRSIAALEITG